MYNIKYYTNRKIESRNKFYKNRPLFVQNSLDTNRIFFEYILAEIKKIRRRSSRKIRILDLGTGTGYVPDVLCQLSKENFSIVGVDLSGEMIKKAESTKMDQRIKYLQSDNKVLPFRDNYFDIVTNKLTTQFSIKEMSRVLKSGGVFIFKEYGEYKGFKEIFQLFRNRYVKTKNIFIDYLSGLQNNSFEDIILRTFSIKRKYSSREIAEIFNMANIIRDFSPKDLEKIDNELGGKGKINITSDPFIIFARKA